MEVKLIMAYVSIPKDLTAVKTKFILGLTKRQSVCFGLAILKGVPLFFLTRGFLPTNASALLMVVVMLPFFLFAMYEKNGQPLEKYLKSVIAVKYQKPAIRTYQTNNLYTTLQRQSELHKEVTDIATAKETNK